MVAAPRGRRRWLFRSAAVLFGLVLGSVVVEGTVRLFPKLLSPKLRHLAFSKYDTTAFFAGRTEWILPGDGHLNPTGNRELAAFLHTAVFPTP